MDQSIFEALKSIGLTEGESKVYLGLLSVGTSSVGPIIDKSGVSASKVYIILDKLVNKGLVSIIVQKAGKQFTPASPERLVELLGEEEEKIKKNRERVKNVLPHLNLLRNSASKLPAVEFSTGNKGFESHYAEMISNAPTGSTYTSIAGQRIGFKMQHFWSGHSVRMNKKHIRQVMSYEHDLWYRKDPDISRRAERKDYFPRILPEKYQGLPNIAALGNITIISDVEEGEVFTLLIRQKNLTTAIKKLLTIVYDAGEDVSVETSKG